MKIYSPFSELSWYKMGIDFVIQPRSHGVKFGYLIPTVQAIIHGISASSWPSYTEGNEGCPLFHIRDINIHSKVRSGTLVSVEVFFTKQNLKSVESWKTAAHSYFDVGHNIKNLDLVDLGSIKKRNFQSCLSDLGDIPEEGEICLEFLVPYYFKPEKGKPRVFLGKERFISGYLKRLSRLFSINFRYSSRSDNFNILPCYWHYDNSIRHDSKSQHGNEQLINGCVGPLYIKGKFQDFLPYVVLGGELHVGAKLSNAQGYYKIHRKSLPYFKNQKHFPDKRELQSVVRDGIENYDQALGELSEELYPFNESNYAENLCKEISKMTYTPSPNKAFYIRKKEGRHRIVERLEFPDLIVSLYLKRLLTDIFDNLFEDESLGYRKGISRGKAAKLINKTISEGYEFLLESDIEDFFSSIDINKLIELLELYIPFSDDLINVTIRKIIDNGYILEGLFHPRKKGLAQGNPLSPLFTNLYLDSFDEAIKRLDVRLIRYADDFVIFVKSREKGEAILSEIKKVLSGLGLKVKKEKTMIRSINEGFQFLGMVFDGKHGLIEIDSELKLYKKPLYITEPFVYLSLNGDAVEIKKNQKIIETIPLRRISEIMVMERTVFSSALLRKCIDFSIPFTITLNTGYFITTIKPDSSDFYSTSSKHTHRYNSLSETETLSIAKGFAANKITNYMPLFRQRYQKGYNEILKELMKLASKAELAATIQELRGIEGAAAKKVFDWMNLLIENPQFQIKKRQRRNPDRINSLLNFGYYLLFSRINATVRGLGLNPYLGFLHSSKNKYESLVSDIVDVFRSRIDRLIIRLVNLKIIKPEDFIETDRGFFLNKDAVKKFLSQFEKDMQKRPNKTTLSLKEHIYFQVFSLRSWVKEETSLSYYTWEK